MLPWRLGPRNTILGSTKVTKCCHWGPIGMWVQKEIIRTPRRTDVLIVLTVVSTLSHYILLFAHHPVISIPSTEIKREVEIQVFCLKWFSLEGVLIWVSMKIYLFDLCPTKFPQAPELYVHQFSISICMLIRDNQRLLVPWMHLRACFLTLLRVWNRYLASFQAGHSLVPSKDALWLWAPAILNSPLWTWILFLILLDLSSPLTQDPVIHFEFSEGTGLVDDSDFEFKPRISCPLS